MQDKAPIQANVKDMMTARETRAMRQQAMLKRQGLPLVSFTLNIPGPVKNSPLIAEAFDHGTRLIEARLKQLRIPATEKQLTRAFTGDELLMSCQADPLALKRFMCQLDEESAFGRLMDIDVLDTAGLKIPREAAGFPPRPCLLCPQPASICAPSRAHQVEDLFHKAEEIITTTLNLSRARAIGLLAQKSLIAEALATPKPGLVDRDNSGAHKDMDISSFMHSACALRGYFEDAALTGMRLADEAAPRTMAALRPLGLGAEAAMYEATGGVNTHKGSIYALGILCAAAGRIWAHRAVPGTDALFDTAGLIAAEEAGLLPALAAQSPDTNGLRLYASAGITGARGEAAAGFPAARRRGLPQLRKYLAEGQNMNDALAFTLIHLISVTQDTNLIKRAGQGRWQQIQNQLISLLARGPLTLQTLRQLDEQFIRENLSPGGSADLLSAACFAHWIEEAHAPRMDALSASAPFCISLD